MASKVLERLYLDSFLKSVGWDNYQVEDGESPDFIIRSESQALGIEVTNVFKDTSQKGSKLKKEESARNRLLVKLTKEYYTQGGSPIVVQGEIWNLPDEDDTQNLLLKLHGFREFKPWETGKLCLESKNKKLIELFITRLPDSIMRYERWICMNNSRGWIKTLDRKLIEETIHEKSLRIIEYKRVTDNVILLIIADRTKNSGMLQWKAQGKFSSHGFTSVYIHIFPFESHKIA